MASALARATLARAAATLNANAGVRLPSLILLTDDDRVRDPVSAALALPKGAAVILRAADVARRAELARRLSAIAHEKPLRLLIAGDAALASRVAAAGLHLPERRAREAAHWKALRPSWLITVAAHSAQALAILARAGADAALLAPAFATRSHLDRTPLGAAKFRLMAGKARVPVYALGGINALSIRRLAGAKIAGIAAIEGLLPDHRA